MAIARSGGLFVKTPNVVSVGIAVLIGVSAGVFVASDVVCAVDTGLFVGTVADPAVGAEVGAVVGLDVGAAVGLDVGAVVGLDVGAAVGAEVGSTPTFTNFQTCVFEFILYTFIKTLFSLTSRTQLVFSTL